jgi:phosphonatase-like hydrolase
MKDIDLVIFDMAGTTVLDAGQVPEAFRIALQPHGIPVTDEALRAVRGASKREAIRRLVELHIPGNPAEMDQKAGQIFEAFRQHLAKSYAQGGVQPIPGAAQTFAWLRARGIKVVLNTGFDRSITDLLLQAIGWDHHAVDAVICGDDVPQGRPAPFLIFRAMEAAGVFNVRRVMNVGDTVLDLQAGFNAGAGENIAVLSGAHSREQLEKAPHTRLLASVAEIPALWSGGLG